MIFMIEIQDDHLEFVAKRFVAGALNPLKAWRNVRKRISRPRIQYGYILAAGVAAAAIIIGVFAFNPDRYNQTTVAAEATARTVILPDRTRATLAPGATLSINRRRFAHKDRTVKQDGKVYYDVEYNEALPFEVRTAGAFVRVLGTVFQVDGSSDYTSVDVVSGRVLFTSVSKDSEGIVLTRGMHAGLHAGSLKPELSEASSMNPAAWANHQFVYDDAPLDAVLQELSSVFGRTVTCPQQGRALNGEFHAETLEDAVGIIEAALGLKLTVL